MSDTQIMTHPQNVEFLFFDVGNVLVSDDPAAAFLYRRLYEHLGGPQRWSPEEFFSQRLAFVRNGGDLWTFVRAMIPPDEFESWRSRTRRDLFQRWEHYSPPIPGMSEVLRQLKESYRLGLIANQPPQIEQVLKKRGLWELFDIHAISDVLGVAKPDLEIFRWALARAGVAPARTAMIGDRVDNDVAPAKSLGMSTVWFTLDFDQRGWRPTDAFELAYAESIRAHCVSNRPPRRPEEEPHAIARSPQELLSHFGFPSRRSLAPVRKTDADLDGLRA